MFGFDLIYHGMEILNSEFLDIVLCLSPKKQIILMKRNEKCKINFHQNIHEFLASRDSFWANQIFHKQIKQILQNLFPKSYLKLGYGFKCYFWSVCRKYLCKCFLSMFLQVSWVQHKDILEIFDLGVILGMLKKFHPWLWTRRWESP